MKLEGKATEWRAHTTDMADSCLLPFRASRRNETRRAEVKKLTLSLQLDALGSGGLILMNEGTERWLQRVQIRAIAKYINDTRENPFTAARP